MKLFAIYVGGEHPGAHIEVHDIRFAVAEDIAGTHARLLAEWWGTPGTLHIDCWAAIEHADGHDIKLRPQQPSGDLKLYFVNLGGYAPGLFAEEHRNLFVVAASAREAKARALATISGWTDAHKDELYDADQIIVLGTKALGQGLHIHLEPAREARAPEFVCDYVPLK